MTCPYSKDTSSKSTVCLTCTVSNDPCGLYYVCPVSGKPVMNAVYKEKGCPVKTKQDKIVSAQKELGKRPTKKGTNELIAVVNYCNHAKHITSISYNPNGEVLSMFLDGEYSGALKITYHGNSLNKENIVEIKEI